MSEIRISPTAQAVAIVTVIAAIAAAVAAQIPELRRYLKVESM
jgi:hypothetical protein